MIIGKKDKKKLADMVALYEDLCKAIEATADGGIKRLEESGKSQARKLEFILLYLKEFRGLADVARRRFHDVTHTK